MPDITVPEATVDKATDSPEVTGASTAERSLLADLLESSRLYRTSKDYLELLQFVARMRNFAPFNAMLIQVQKPGVRFAASAYDWRIRFDRTIREGARPLLVLAPFGPVALVYDVADTEGENLPSDVQSAFRATGTLTKAAIAGFISLLSTRGVHVTLAPAGDGLAGSVRAERRATRKGEKPDYRLLLNQSHDSNVQFATLAHELAHLFLGHLGGDIVLDIPDRHIASHAMRELEAESVSYLICTRMDVQTSSESYLHSYVNRHTTVHGLDLHTMLRAAGQIERMLLLTEQTRFEPSGQGRKALRGKHPPRNQPHSLRAH